MRGQMKWRKEFTDVPRYLTEGIYRDDFTANESRESYEEKQTGIDSSPVDGDSLLRSNLS